MITHPRPTWPEVPSAPKVTLMHHVFATDRSNTAFFGAVALTKPFERKRIKATGCLGQLLEQGPNGILGPKLIFVTGLVTFVTAVARLVCPDLLG